MLKACAYFESWFEKLKTRKFSINSFTVVNITKKICKNFIT